MTFNQLLPLSTDKIRNFPGNVTTNNWPRIVANINADHLFQNTAGITPPASIDQTGFHKVIRFITQTVDPGNLADSIQLYAKDFNGLTVPNMKVKNSSTIYPICSNNLANPAMPGYTSTLGGISFIWGQVSVIDTNPHTQTILPAMNSTIFAVWCQPVNNSDSNETINLVSITSPNQFTWAASSTNISSFYFLAIGI